MMRRCPDCAGSGQITTTLRVSGEAFDADLVSHVCTDCAGRGELLAVCGFCEDVLSADGFCQSCEEHALATFPVTVAVTGSGQVWA
jgi:DnaJ-class molecular chaperone